MWALAMLVALLADLALGWPDALFRRIGHPVTWIGRLIDAIEHRLNRPEATDAARRLGGVVLVVTITGVSAGLAWALARMLPGGVIGAVLTGLIAWPLVAAKSLASHVRAVARPLALGDLSGARAAVAMIVGRDPSAMDAPAIARATLESLAENTSDGIVAPLFWGALLGLPGIAAYKAINTMDSMVGHLSPRYRAFGWAAARLDDLVNLVPARLSGALFALTGPKPRAALGLMWAQARRHRSPNAGFPEAALAGALSRRLSGPRLYEGVMHPEPWLNGTAPDPDAADIDRALNLYRRLLLALGAMLALLALSSL